MDDVIEIQPPRGWTASSAQANAAGAVRTPFPARSGAQKKAERGHPGAQLSGVEIQDVADYVGDSLGLSQQAAKPARMSLSSAACISWLRRLRF